VSGNLGGAMKEYYLVKEVAEIFSVKEKTIRRMIDAREIGAIKIRSALRIHRSDVEKLKRNKKK
jgi:excisionase family DNA binding protein